MTPDEMAEMMRSCANIVANDDAELTADVEKLVAASRIPKHVFAALATRGLPELLHDIQQRAYMLGVRTGIKAMGKTIDIMVDPKKGAAA